MNKQNNSLNRIVKAKIAGDIKYKWMLPNCSNYHPMPLTFSIPSTSGILCESASADFKVYASAAWKNLPLMTQQVNIVRNDRLLQAAAWPCVPLMVFHSTAAERKQHFCGISESIMLCTQYIRSETLKLFLSLCIFSPFHFTGNCYILLWVWISQSLYRWNQNTCERQQWSSALFSFFFNMRYCCIKIAALP